MAGSAPPSSAAVDVGGLNLPEAVVAFGTFAARRAQRVAQLATALASGEKRPAELVVDTLDGNEADLEELSLHPIALAEVAGLLTAREMVETSPIACVALALARLHD